MIALPYTLSLCEPLLMTQPNSGEANSGTSLAYVPGSALRGALIRAYRDAHPDGDLDTDATSRRLFFSNQTCFLSAYPIERQSGTRMLPKPRSWFTAKDQVDDQEATVYDFAITIKHKLDKPKAPNGEFAWHDGSVAYLRNTERQITLHNASTNRNEKTQGPSQVFRYEALAEREILAGVILSENEADLLRLKPFLDEAVIVLGGSHTGGYGRVTVSTQEINPEWQEYSPEEEADGTIILTLLSDALLRHPVAGHVTTSLAEGLSITIERSFQAVTVVGGFNRTWGLPLPQARAIAAGSVFCLQAGSVTQEQLDE